MKKGFTLLEILIVVIIISILIIVIGSFLPSEQDKKTKFGKECSNYIFQEILNEKNNVEKNKTINSGGQIISHLSSEIKKHGENQSLVIESTYENNIEISKELTNSGGFCLAEHVSNRNNYVIRSNEGFLINIQKDNIYSSNNKILSVCDNEGNNCVEVSKINYNKASNRFEQQFCLSFTGSICEQGQE